MIGIRADANDIVATGHIMRCITIAKQIQKLGEEIVFFLADEYGVSMLEDSSMEYVILHTNWENPIEEIPILCKKIAEYDISAVLFDSYRMPKEYFEKLRYELDGYCNGLKSVVRFAYIDDLFEDVYPVDVLINYNAYYTQFPYEETYAGGGSIDKGTAVQLYDVMEHSSKTVLCLGPSYVPLREEFGRTDLADGMENSVLLSCGGGDILQTLHGILSQAVKDNRFQNVKFHIIVGRYHQKKELLEQLAVERENVILHHDVHNMAELMEQCQIAVSAAGTMLYELCAMERPTVFFITADNQRYDSDFFATDERMVFAGDIRMDRDGCIQQVLDGMQELFNNNEKCTLMKDKLRSVTDGKGAERIAKVLIEK